MSSWSDGMRMADRSYMGICLECDRKFDGDDETDRGICLVCKAQDEALYGEDE